MISLLLPPPLLLKPRRGGLFINQISYFYKLNLEAQFKIIIKKSLNKIHIQLRLTSEYRVFHKYTGEYGTSQHFHIKARFKINSS